MTHAFANELEKHVLTDMKRMLMKLCDDMPVLSMNEVMVWFDEYTKKTPKSTRGSVSTKVDPNIEIMDGPSVEHTVDEVIEPKKKTVTRGKKKAVVENADAEASNAEASNAEAIVADEDVPKKKTAARGKKKVVGENTEASIVADEDVPKKKTAARGKKKVVDENVEANAEASVDADEDVPKKKTAARGKKKVVDENVEANAEASIVATKATASGVETSSEMCDSYYPK